MTSVELTPSILRDDLVTQTPPEPVRIGLDGDGVWQRFLAANIAKEREFAIFQLDGALDTGFVTGFDQVCVQMSTSEKEPRSILIRSAAIAKIAPTNRRVTDLDGDLGDGTCERIRGFSYALRQSALRAVPQRDPRHARQQRNARPTADPV